MKYLILVPLILLALHFNPSTASACYEPGFSGDTFGPNGFSLEWSSLGEAAAFGQAMLDLNQVLADDWNASHAGYDAKYGPQFAPIARSNRLHVLDGLVRAMYIHQTVLASFGRCN